MVTGTASKTRASQKPSKAGEGAKSLAEELLATGGRESVFFGMWTLRGYLYSKLPPLKF